MAVKLKDQTVVVGAGYSPARNQRQFECTTEDGVVRVGKCILDKSVEDYDLTSMPAEPFTLNDVVNRVPSTVLVDGSGTYWNCEGEIFDVHNRVWALTPPSAVGNRFVRFFDAHTPVSLIKTDDEAIYMELIGVEKDDPRPDVVAISTEEDDPQSIEPIDWDEPTSNFFGFFEDEHPHIVPASEAVEPMAPVSEQDLATMVNKLSAELTAYSSVRVEPGYEPLFAELITALDQSQAGKGKERHANGLPFLEQPIMTNARQCGAGGPAQQVMKKTGEAIGMHKRGETDRAIKELHGAMVYAAATILSMKEGV